MLTDGQIGLLSAMHSSAYTRVTNGIVWIDRRPYALQDLYALRAAGLVRRDEIRTGATTLNGFTLTDRGKAEAERRDAQPTSSHDQPRTLPAVAQPAALTRIGPAASNGQAAGMRTSGAGRRRRPA